MGKEDKPTGGSSKDEKSNKNDANNSNGNDASSLTLLEPNLETKATDEALPAVMTNWGSATVLRIKGCNTYTTGSNSSTVSQPANNSHEGSASSFNSEFLANLEAFSTGCSVANSDDGVMSTSEASSIMEKHIAEHPIETENDFQYIAELLRNYENEEDLKRVAELIRASKNPILTPQPSTKKNKETESKKKKSKEDPQKRRKEKEKKRKKKHKRTKYWIPSPIDEDEIAYNDVESSSESSSESDSSRQMQSSVASNCSSLSSSVRKDFKRKKKSKKKDREKKAKKKTKKEEQKKNANKEKYPEDEAKRSVIEPPTSIQVVKTNEEHANDNGSTQQSSADTSNKDWQPRGKMLQGIVGSKSDDSDGDGPVEMFENEFSQKETSNSSNTDDDENGDGTIETFDNEFSQKQETTSDGDSDDGDDGEKSGSVEAFKDEPSQISETSATPANSTLEICLNEPIEAAQSPTPVPKVSIGTQYFPYPGMLQHSNSSLSNKGGPSKKLLPPVIPNVTSQKPDESDSSSTDNSYPGRDVSSSAALEVDDNTETEFSESVAQDDGANVPFPPMPQREVPRRLPPSRETDNLLTLRKSTSSDQPLPGLRAARALSSSVNATSKLSRSVPARMEGDTPQLCLTSNDKPDQPNELDESLQMVEEKTKEPDACNGLAAFMQHDESIVLFGQTSSENLKKSSATESSGPYGEHATIHVRQQPIAEEEKNETIEAEFSIKPRLLCLHGWRSNAEVTRLQLENLGLLSFFDPVFIGGPHVSNEAADDTVQLLSRGPYYSWVETVGVLSDSTADGRQENGESRVKASDELMLSLKAVMVHLLAESKHLDSLAQENPEAARIPCYDAVYGFSQGATLLTLLSYDFVRKKVLAELNLPPMKRLPWGFAISACAANAGIVQMLSEVYEPDLSMPISMPSVHIIGLSDSRKTQSESIMKGHFESKNALPIYLDSGHGIPAATKSLSYATEEIINWFLLKITLPGVDVANVPLQAQSESVSMLHVMDDIDRIHTEKSHSREDAGQLNVGAYGQYIITNNGVSSSKNLIEMLEHADPKSLALQAPGVKPLTYENLLQFIRNDGDLRAFGAQEGFTVAYVAPYGAVSATAFITIAAQCTAAPLDPGYNEVDYFLALEQLKPDLVITFDGVDRSLVHKVALGQGLRVAHAIVKQGTCGLFRCEKERNALLTESALSRADNRLVNHADECGLVLRSTEKTSKPKVVLSTLGDIIANSLTIARNLGLQSSDVALNAMPLFRVEGLYTNLLAALAAGASVVLLPKFKTADFFDALTSAEEPKPTWYCAAPTMHAAIQQFSEDSIFKTSLRFILSTADPRPHDLVVKMEETFGCPMVLMYSKTEQVPISQTITGPGFEVKKPNSVGHPVCASVCIVDKNLRPLPFPSETGKELIDGEICISGPMVVQGYSTNPAAYANSFFRMGGMDWFRTGDMGHLDKEGFLFLTGHTREDIRRGGDLINPSQVENAIYACSDAVKTAIVFPIPDSVWGERVGVAVALKQGAVREEIEFKSEIHKSLLKRGLQSFKLPETVALVKDEDLPKTRNDEYIRAGLAQHLGLNLDKERNALRSLRAVNYHEAAVGLKFFLAFAVIYVHIGNFDNRDLDEYADFDYQYQWENSRSWNWHYPILFLVSGFLLAAGTHHPVTHMRDFADFYSLRIAGLHPVYLISILFCTANFVARCNPSNFISDFDRLQMPVLGEHYVCQSSPIEWSYFPTLVISIVSYICTLQSWPILMPFSWFLSYYTWFSSVYVFCIFAFPWCHQQFHAVRDDISKIWKLTLLWLGMSYIYVAGISVVFYMNNDILKNYFAISSYIFPLGWFPFCACGIGCFFLFRHYRPNEKRTSWVWGGITDLISILLLVGWLFYGLAPTVSTPSFAEDDRTVKFHWVPFLSRILAPIGFLWFWGLAVGTGYTSKFFSIPLVVEWLAPASYNMILFHQPISEWYYLATRGEWWAYPKPFYWFSPHPYPVAIWEFFIVAGLVVAFSVFMEAFFNELLVSSFSNLRKLLFGHRGSKSRESVFYVVQSIAHRLTHADIRHDTVFAEAGLNSMSTIILVSEIKKVYKTLRLTVPDVISCETIRDLVDVIEGRMEEAAIRPELALSKRSGVVACVGNVQHGETAKLLPAQRLRLERNRRAFHVLDSSIRNCAAGNTGGIRRISHNTRIAYVIQETSNTSNRLHPTRSSNTTLSGTALARQAIGKS